MVDSEEKKLNQEQLAAIKYGKGPLLIIAGAGTGKTTVVTERIKWLVAKGLAKPSEILALTFTDKAAREMEERVDIAMPYGYTEMWISTFHAFCDRVLRAEAIHIGLDPGYKLMTEAETIQFLISNLFKFDLKYFRPLGNPTKFVDGMLQHFSRLKDEDVTPNEYIHWVNSKLKTQSSKEETEKHLELAKAYQAYEDLKIKEGVADFGDLVSQVLRLFRTRKNILRQYQKQFKYILVDEFQDTNYAQNELAILLAEEKQNITVCADDDQCLPPETKILTPEGGKKIKSIKVGDKVITAIGKGYTSVSKVIHIQKNRKKVRLLTFATDRGTKLMVTDNHKMFCFVPPRVYGKKEFYYVYLMRRQSLGWRLGITNDLIQRLRLERSADMIIGIKACRSEQEARYFETFYSLKYRLPTVPFMARKGMVITNGWLEKLYKEIDTESNAQKLAEDLRIDLRAYHCCLGGVVRGNKARIKIKLRICKRKYRTKWARGRYLITPNVWHEVNLETSDQTIIERIRVAGIALSDAKKGKQVRRAFTDLVEAGKFVQELIEITGGVLDIKFDVGKKSGYARQAVVLPASNVMLGHYLPVFKNFEIVYEKVVDIKQEEKLETVYDLEIDRTHNFIANNVVVHNSIYRWRGAAISNVIQFKNRFPKAKIVVLIRNYRSTQIILDQAYRLIQNNNPDRLEAKEKIDKHLKAVREIKEWPIEFIHADRVENEAELVAKKIDELTEWTEKKYEYKDFAILVRANNQAEPFVRALGRLGIPYQFLGPGQLFRQPEVKDLIAYLEVLYNFEDNVALFRVLSLDLFDINARDLAAINNYGRRQNLSLFEACEQVGKIFVSSKTQQQIANFVLMVHRHLGLISKETAGQILYYFLQDSGLLKKLTECKLPIEERQAQNISKFFDRLKTYEVDHEDASVQAVVNWVNLSMQLGESPLANNIDWVEENRVNLLTVHSSKGLEFSVVFLVNLVADRFPTRERREQIPIPEALIKEILPTGDSHQQEERRLFYVGMTRAKDRLFLSAADYYGEGKRERKLSPFVKEALGEEIEKKTIISPAKQLSILDWQKPVEEKKTIPLLNYPINYLSYSQIETFNACPLQYRYRYISRIPVPPSAALSLGDSIHKTLRDFYQNIKAGRKLQEKDLLEILKVNWSFQGYTSKAHEEKAKKQAGKMLRQFYLKVDPAVVPKDLEQLFMIKISSELKIGGKIDWVAEKGRQLEIIDYKTGRIWDQKTVDQSLQMTIYALAATDRGIYNRRPEELILTFYFLETAERKSTCRTTEQLAKTKKDLLIKAKEISQSTFEPTPGRWCDFCDFKLICEAWQ